MRSILLATALVLTSLSFGQQTEWDLNTLYNPPAEQARQTATALPEETDENQWVSYYDFTGKSVEPQLGQLLVRQVCVGIKPCVRTKVIIQ